MKIASYWARRGDDRLQCELCPQACVLSEGEAGDCLVRRMQEGQLIATTYGRVTSASLDPIEKKPLYHFFPGRRILSIGSIGCNFHCLFCQNHETSQTGNLAYTQELPPKAAVELALRQPGNLGLCYTYNEPLIQFEYVLDCSKLVREAGLCNVLVSNGYINPKPLAELIPFIDAINVDIKSLDEGYYNRLCGGKLKPVQRAITELVKAKVHVELTNLLVTGQNDSDDQIKRLVDWVASLSEDIPLHFSRYFPQYQMDLPATPEERLDKAYELGRARLNYVYLGNVLSSLGSNTHCVECGNLLVVREGYSTRLVGLQGAACDKCGAVLAGRFEE